LEKGVKMISALEQSAQTGKQRTPRHVRRRSLLTCLFLFGCATIAAVVLSVYWQGPQYYWHVRNARLAKSAAARYEHARKALSIRPWSAEAQVLVADSGELLALETFGESRDALEAVRPLLVVNSMDPDRPEPYGIASLIMFKKGDYGKAAALARIELSKIERFLASAAGHNRELRDNSRNRAATVCRRLALCYHATGSLEAMVNSYLRSTEFVGYPVLNFLNEPEQLACQLEAELGITLTKDEAATVTELIRRYQTTNPRGRP
jgi:hypothetical protein